jgi:hypothetical protein
MVYFQSPPQKNWKNFKVLRLENVDIFYAIGIFYGRAGYFMTIWYIFPVLVSCIKKNLATLRELHEVLF